MEDDWASLLTTERHARIRAALEQFRGQSSLYLDPDIPAKKLANARASTQIPATERVLGLIDCTVFGSAKNAIVFGETALYYHNSWTVSSQQYRGRAMHDYGAFAKLELAKANLEVRFSGGAIETAGSNFSTPKMIELLTALQRSVLHGLEIDERKPVGAAYIAPYLVDRTCLDASNELWPCGIATHADASAIVPPLERRWTFELDGAISHTPAIARDFVIVATRKANTFFGATVRLVGIELTTGREYWRRELSQVHWSRPVATHGCVFLKGGAYWHAFDIETGEPRPIESHGPAEARGDAKQRGVVIEISALPRAVRDQLTLADATISVPAEYAGFAAELAYPQSVDAAPPLRAANHLRRIYAHTGVQERAPALRIIDDRGIHHLRGDHRGELLSLAMTEHLVFAGTRDRRLLVGDPERPAWVSKMDVPVTVDHVAVGSDHVIIAGGGAGSGDGRVCCYKGS